MKITSNLKEKQIDKTIEKRFEEIATILRRSVTGVLQTGRLIYEASLDSGAERLNNMLVSRNVLAKSTISQYRTIGACEALHTPEIEGKLPASFNSIYHLAKLESNTPGFLINKIEKGELNASTKLEEVRKWTEKSVSAWASMSIDIDATLTLSERKEIKGKLIKYLKSIEVKVKVPSTRLKKTRTQKGK